MREVHAHEEAASLDGVESLGDVGDKVLGRLDAAREAHHVRGDAASDELFVVHLAMRRVCRVQTAGAGMGNGRGERGEKEGGEKRGGGGGKEKKEEKGKRKEEKGKKIFG